MSTCRGNSALNLMRQEDQKRRGLVVLCMVVQAGLLILL